MTRVREAAIVMGLLVVLGGSGALLTLPWVEVAQAGVALLALGLVAGLPTGFWYHVLLYRALQSQGGAPAGWIWRPLTLHDRLPDDRRRRVLAWCRAGGAGFVVICLGLWVLAIAAVSALAGYDRIGV